MAQASSAVLVEQLGLSQISVAVEGASLTGTFFADAQGSGCPILHISSELEKTTGVLAANVVDLPLYAFIHGLLGATWASPVALDAELEKITRDTHGTSTFSRVYVGKRAPVNETSPAFTGLLMLRSVWSGGYRYVLGFITDVSEADLTSASTQTALLKLEQDMLNPFAPTDTSRDQRIHRLFGREGIALLPTPPTFTISSDLSSEVPQKATRSLKVTFLPKLLTPEHAVEKSLVVLFKHRSTSTVTTALGEGGNGVQMLGSAKQLIEKTKLYARSNVITAGEKKLQKIPTLDCGNSPLEFVNRNVRDKTVLLLLYNNAAAAVRFVRLAKQLILGSLLNVSAIVRAVLDSSPELPVLFVCGGDSQGSARSPADELMAAFVLRQLVGSSKGEFTLDESARMLLEESAHLFTDSDSQGAMYSRFREAFYSCPINRQLLWSEASKLDPEFCTQIDRYRDVLPTYVPFLEMFVAKPIMSVPRKVQFARPSSSLSFPQSGYAEEILLRPRKVRLVLCQCPFSLGTFHWGDARSKGADNSLNRAEVEKAQVEKGFSDAQVMANRVRTSSWSIASIECSPLKRAVFVAETVGKTLGLNPRSNSKLTAMDRGDWEGLSVDEVRLHYPGDYDRWCQDFDFKDHGGESVHELMARGCDALQSIIDRTVRSPAVQRPRVGGKTVREDEIPTVVIVTHLTIIAGILMSLEAKQRQSQDGKIPWDSYLGSYPDGGLVVLNCDVAGFEEGRSLSCELAEWPLGPAQWCFLKMRQQSHGASDPYADAMLIPMPVRRDIATTLMRQGEGSPSVSQACVVSAVPLPKLLQPDHSLEDSIVVLVDALRYSSTVVSGMGEGMHSAEPFSSSADVKAAARDRTPGSCILGGEAKRVLIPGFHRDNSPRSYVQGVQGVTSLMLTTNGTRALPWVSGAKFLVLGSLLNVDAVVTLIQSNLDRVGSILLVAAGEERGTVRALDDELCLSVILKMLIARIADPAKLILDELATKWLSGVDGLSYADFSEQFRATSSAKKLGEVGLAGDVEWCLNLNKYWDVLPIYSSSADGKGGAFIRYKVGSSRSDSPRVPRRRFSSPASSVRVYVVVASRPPTGTFTGRVDTVEELPSDAKALAQIMSRMPLDMVVCSPLRRARVMAQEIARLYFAALAEKGIQLSVSRSVEVHNGLTAIDWGEWTGLEEASVKAFYPGAIEMWNGNPGWQDHGGESWQRVIARTKQMLVEVFASERVLESARCVCIVGHTSTVRSLATVAQNLPQQDWVNMDVPPNTVSCFDYFPGSDVPLEQKWRVNYIGYKCSDFHMRYVAHKSSL